MQNVDAKYPSLPKQRLNLIMYILRVIHILGVVGVFVQGDPQGCTYTAAEAKYVCSVRNWSPPLELYQFTNQPQVLHVIEMDGEIGSASSMAGVTFSGFGSINTATFNADIIPSLHIKCYSGGRVIMSAGSFDGFSYVKEVRFFDCEILNIPDNVFSDFQELNYLSFDGGQISSIGYDAFYGLNLYAMDVPNPMGTFAIRNAKITAKTLPNGALYPIANATNIIIENADLETLQHDMFQVSTQLLYLSLSNNIFTSLPETLFSKTYALNRVDVVGIPWDCSCTNMWFVDNTDNITINGDIVCATPSTHNGSRYREYDLQNCFQPNACDNIGIPGVVISSGKHCLTYWSITNFVMLFFALVFSCISLGLICHTMRQHRNAKEKIQGLETNGSLEKWNRLLTSREEKENLSKMEIKHRSEFGLATGLAG